MCSATPQSSVAAGAVGRIVEDPEQHGRVGGQVLGEPFGGEAEPEGDAAHHRLGDPMHLVEPAQDDRSEVGRFGGEEVGAVQSDAGADPGVVGSVLGAEVDALLAIGAARRQLAADREPSAPRPPGPRTSRSPPWRRSSSAKNSCDERSRSSCSVGSTPCPTIAEEADLATRPVDLGRHGSSRRVWCRPGRARARCRRSAGRWNPDREVGAAAHNW